MTRISLADYPLPLLDADLLAASGPPDNAVKLKRMLGGASGRVHCQPGIHRLGYAAPEERDRLGHARARRRRTRALRRVQGPRVRARAPLSAGAAGGLHALMALRQILELGCGALVLPEQINVGRAEAAFDDMDNLKDEDLATALKEMVRRLIELASVMPRTTE